MPLGLGGKLAVEYPCNALQKLHKQAFQQHCLRSDHRDGQKRYKSVVPETESEIPPVREGVVAQGVAGQGRSKSTNRPGAKTARILTTTDDKFAENAKAKSTDKNAGVGQEAFKGYVEMISTQFNGVVRCGFSEACDADKASEFERYLKNVCPWKRRSMAMHGATVIGVPVREQPNEEVEDEQWDPAVARWPFLKKFPKTAQPRSGPELGPGKNDPVPPTPMLPRSIRQRLQTLQRSDATRSSSGRPVLEEDSVCADVERLLRNWEIQRCNNSHPMGPGQLRIPISKLVMAVPDLTAARWRIWLQSAGEGPHGLARSLDEALRRRNDTFHVTNGAIDGTTEVNLVNASQPLSASGLVWLDLLPALNVLGPLAAHVGDAWSSTIDLAQFVKVAQAMERAASLGLTKPSSFGLLTEACRGKWLFDGSRRGLDLEDAAARQRGSPDPNMTPDIAPWGDSTSTRNNTVIMPSASSSSPEDGADIRYRRPALAEDDNARANAAVNHLSNRGKLEAKWLDGCLNEQSDDEEYEDGNAVQHLYNAVSVHFGHAKNVHNDTFKREARRDVSTGSSSSSDLPPGISQEIWVKMCQWHPQLSHLEAKYELFNTALVAWNSVVVQKAEPVRTVCPLLFSLLMQEAAVQKGVHPGDLVRDLLWRQCHWDFPAGRQLLRQIKKVFDCYARAGTLNQAGFLRLAQDVGLLHENCVTRTGVRERLARAFAEQMQSTAPASFVEFIRLLEYVSTFLRVKGAEGTWPMLKKVADAHKDIKDIV
eukprot:gnl/MRDRNA2_/MRDRNA2_95663_c0_seq1.p1 gnl/MRDRNA2_/MRDRNA2_95663_c0~~gnl/MRDRNA2_/MRDRNA2_95663_c0_seq1.p1  ORF type:complete len:766 (+),score=140.85 gnl/MRDRNA2_/MRDRNA2_95663_c0_seq1:108-2405(+)